jgi:hypothetical protein
MLALSHGLCAFGAAMLALSHGLCAFGAAMLALSPPVGVTLFGFVAMQAGYRGNRCAKGIAVSGLWCVLLLLLLMMMMILMAQCTLLQTGSRLVLQCARCCAFSGLSPCSCEATAVTSCSCRVVAVAWVALWPLHPAYM